MLKVSGIFQQARVISIKGWRSGELCDLKGQFIYKNSVCKTPAGFFFFFYQRDSLEAQISWEVRSGVHITVIHSNGSGSFRYGAHPSVFDPT